tara:strand:+ start:1321 stop:1548 length:228 start_codon:yes stop_codon:yes gene_type:complete
MIVLKYIFVLYFSLTDIAYSYIDPGFFSSLGMYLFMIINFLVIIFFVYPRELLKKIYKKIFNKKKEDSKNVSKNK